MFEKERKGSCHCGLLSIWKKSNLKPHPFNFLAVYAILISSNPYVYFFFKKNTRELRLQVSVAGMWREWEAQAKVPAAFQLFNSCLFCTLAYYSGYINKMHFPTTECFAARNLLGNRRVLSLPLDSKYSSLPISWRLWFQVRYILTLWLYGSRWRENWPKQCVSSYRC